MGRGGWLSVGYRHEQSIKLASHIKNNRGNIMAPFVAAVIVMNICLAFFNLIPCPPLDGGAILHGILPRDLEWITDSLKTYGFIILFALLYSGAISKIMGPIVGLAGMWLDILQRVA